MKSYSPLIKVTAAHIKRARNVGWVAVQLALNDMGCRSNVYPGGSIWIDGNWYYVDSVKRFVKSFTPKSKPFSFRLCYEWGGERKE